jgi:hypothetical protein
MMSQIRSFVTCASLALVSSASIQAQIMMSMPTPSTKHPVTDADKLADGVLGDRCLDPPENTPPPTGQAAPAARRAASERRNWTRAGESSF